ncbi:hypothetical protein SAMN04488128_103230 [Chitinophaga eiseniae]|uniref:Uncharacterized protein n=1 Tax=Chitinophaga eiseniae TaxID=634771 RepID=A0A1T4SPM7_9BACT|nr:hypothetical protein [Chitinophaga eiseniae]SKA30165.1 hypothetical protein SAMN04488128_103230 [Chitinophaga eiseniae]
MNKHETLIRQIADEMAAQKHPVSFQLYNKYKDKEDNGWSHDSYVKNWHLIVDGYVVHARIAVEWIKKEVSDVLYEVESDGKVIDQWLIDRGLIPEADKEAADDESM